jgi:hypothetical protein
MHKEFKIKPGFESWYSNKHLYSGRAIKKNKNQEKNPDGNWNLIEDKRNFTIHQQPVRPSAHVSVTKKEHISISESISIILTHADGTVERREAKPEPLQVPAETEVSPKWQWYFDELKDKDVVTVCKEHLAKLEALVQECESKFSLQAIYERSKGAKPL